MSVPPPAPPRTVRIAALVTIAEAVVGLCFVIALVVRGLTGDLGGVGTLNQTKTYGEAGYYAVISAAVLAAGIGMWRGHFWARTPSLLLQLLLLGAAWYATVPSERPLVGVVIAVPAVAVLWLMFNRAGRVWSFYGGEAPDAGSR